MLSTLATLPEGAAFDLVVLGAGGAGLAAALHAAIDGASVLVVESTGLVGGTTAWSAGTTWVPGTSHAGTDTLAQAATYLDQVVGARSPAALRQAFLQHGAEAVARLEQHTEVRYRPYALHPDYQSDEPGASLRGRALEPLPFDGRRLGPLFALLRPPIPEFTVLGGMMVDRTDIGHLLALTRSWASFRHAAGLLARHARDRLGHPRGTRLVMGNALVGRLMHSLQQRPGVALLLDCQAQGFTRDEAGAVVGVTLQQAGQRRTVRARGGVVCASGGFNRHPARRAELLPGIHSDWCAGAPGHTGALHDLLHAQGAGYAPGQPSAAYWAPVSRRARPDGSQAVFPHFVLDRAKPGTLTVNQAGERFVNESVSYHLFGLAMQATPGAVPAYLVCDAEALRRYGLGMVRPGGKALPGYLVSAPTLAGLAQQLGVNAAGLQRSVAHINEAAATGIDTQFLRGSTAYQRNLGDASRGLPNPCLGPLATPPFHAVKLWPGDIGAATGFATDEQARVLDAQGRPIAGLYAVGNDMQSVMGGAYPGPGITIGPGLVFAYLAARSALARATTATPAATASRAQAS